MLVSLTVGKVDAGVAVLLTEDKRLIEFPSILLPPDIHSGSIVDIDVSRNRAAEQAADSKFAALQSEIYRTFGVTGPAAPVLRCRNATQTSVVLEWEPLSLATASLRSLSLYRNGARAGAIPPDKRSTKISGLAVDSEYTFQLVLRTSAGTLASERLRVRTHRMTDLRGITVTAGVMAGPLRDDVEATVRRIGARLAETVRIDTTHFVCTEARGPAWEKAVEMNVPVVVPDWIKGCEREGRLVGVRAYYLDADPKLRQLGPSQQQLELAQRGSRPPPQQQSQPQLQTEGPRIEHTPPTPERRQVAGGRAETTMEPVEQREGEDAEQGGEDDADERDDDETIGQAGGEGQNAAEDETEAPADAVDGAGERDASGGTGDEGDSFDEVAL